VTYSPPPGWTERVQPKPGELDRHLAVFHASKTCSRINDVRSLQPVDKPYSAARCAACADTAQ
jgi:hypothetical protein